MLFHKLKVIGTAVVLFALSDTGVGMMAFRSQVASENPPPSSPVSDKPLSAEKRVDLYGDPLPEGAVMRLGTLRRRAVGATLAVSADGKSIVTVRGGKYVCFWDAATGKLREKRTLSTSDVTDSVLSSDGRWLLTGVLAREDHLQLWDLQSGDRPRTLTIEGAGSFWPAAFSADCKAIAAAKTVGEEHRVRVWELATGKVIFQKNARGGTSIHRLTFTPDGKQLLASINANPTNLTCWNLAEGGQHWSAIVDRSPYAMVCTPDRKLLLSD